jgi:hypothetical protein
MRLGDVIWKQVVELRSRNHQSETDDARLAAIFNWSLPYYYDVSRANRQQIRDILKGPSLLANQD